MQIHRSTFAVADGTIEVEMPIGSTIVHVGMKVEEEPDLISLWYECDPERPKAERHFRVVGTGHTMPGVGWVHLGTIVTHRYLVWHVYTELHVKAR